MTERIRIVFDAIGTGPDTAHRVRRLLKTSLRSFGLRAVSVEEMPAMNDTRNVTTSDRQIAEQVGVSDEMIRQHKAALPTVGSQGCHTGRDGRTINTENIGRTPRVLASEIGEDESKPKQTTEGEPCK